MAKVRARVIVEGRVQGVFFRAETQKTARRYNLSGWVRNLSDGRVEALFEGEEENVEKMTLWCHEGPPYAAVRDVRIVREEYTGEFDRFSVTY